MAKKKIKKKKKQEVQDFISKVKELRKINEPITLEELSGINGTDCPTGFEWRGEQFLIQKMIGRWTLTQSGNPDFLLEPEDEQFKNRDCFRVELNNGYQVDISHDLHESSWALIGIETEFFEKMRNITN